MTWKKFFLALTVGSVFGWKFLAANPNQYPIIAPFTFIAFLAILALEKYKARRTCKVTRVDFCQCEKVASFTKTQMGDHCDSCHKFIKRY